MVKSWSCLINTVKVQTWITWHNTAVNRVEELIFCQRGYEEIGLRSVGGTFPPFIPALSVLQDKYLGFTSGGRKHARIFKNVL